MSTRPFEQSFHAMIPTSFTRWGRTFFPWQLIRFAFINLRMTNMILKSHHTKLDGHGGQGGFAERTVPAGEAPKVGTAEGK